MAEGGNEPGKAEVQALLDNAERILAGIKQAEFNIAFGPIPDYALINLTGLAADRVAELERMVKRLTPSKKKVARKGVSLAIAAASLALSVANPWALLVGAAGLADAASDTPAMIRNLGRRRKVNGRLRDLKTGLRSLRWELVIRRRRP